MMAIGESYHGSKHGEPDDSQTSIQHSGKNVRPGSHHHAPHTFSSRCCPSPIQPVLAPFLTQNMGSSTDEDAVEAPKQRTQPHLMPQDASKVDPSKLCALTPEVVRRMTDRLENHRSSDFSLTISSSHFLDFSSSHH